jgi:hypothetical protein
VDRQTCGRWQLLGGGAALCGLVVGSVPWAAIAYQVPAEDGVLMFAWNLGLPGAFTAVGPLLASALRDGDEPLLAYPLYGQEITSQSGGSSR